MKKIMVITVAVALMLGGCAHTDSGGIRDIPDAPGEGPEIIEKEVPVPVLCEVEVTAPQMDIYSVPEDATLEEQNAAVRSTIAQQATYILDLIAGVVGCGGNVRDPHYDAGN